MQPVDQRPLMVRLEEHHINAEPARRTGHQRLDVIERLSAIDLRLTSSEEVQVRPVHHQYPQHHASPSIADRHFSSAPSTVASSSATTRQFPGRSTSTKRTAPERAFLSDFIAASTAAGVNR